MVKVTLATAVADLAERLRRMVGFRNILVHGYQVVDPVKVKSAVEHDLGDLTAFAASIRRRLPDA